MPIMVERLTAPATVTPLERLPPRPLGKSGDPSYRENLIQGLVDAHPSILPVQEIEPVFEGLRSVCMELPLRGGDREKYLDNLLISPAGRVCLVECKLWRNGEAEREAVAQILDYAGEIARMSYEELRLAVRRALKRPEGDPIIERVIGNAVGDQQRGDFIDGVARSLSRGEFLLLLVGDYVRPGVRGIAEFLQRHASLGFAFGLVEMAIYRCHGTEGPFYLQPRVIARTEIITRTVFLAAPEKAIPSITEVEAPKKPITLSEEEFFDDLAKADPAYPQQLRGFLQRCKDRGCVPTLRRKYVLYVDDPLGSRINLGAIDKNGTVEFWGMAARDAEVGAPIGRRYLDRIAALVAGTSVKDDLPRAGDWHLVFNGRASVPLRDMLKHEDQWLPAITDVVDGFARISREQAD
jgi:hypothetical protein